MPEAMFQKDKFVDTMQENHDLHCRNSSCLSCLMKQPNIEKRQSLLINYFKGLPTQASAQQAVAVAGLWTLAMTHPNNADLVEVGVFECMSALMWKGMQDRRWLLQDQNIFIPYYCAHIVGSYTMNREDFAEKAVKEGVIPPLIEFLRGRLTWVEQRVAVRALGHIASYNSTFLSVAVQGEVLELAMELAMWSLDIVYAHFIQFEQRRLRYHRELLTRRAYGGPEIEVRKAEEWASQLQCWSLQLINCFAFKEKYIPTICRPSFLIKLPDMWGGLVNEDSPAGVGLLRTICQHRLGRTSVAACPSVVQGLRRIARSSDDWQSMGLECLLLLLQDTMTRQRVMDMAAVALVDLAELPSLAGNRRKLGREIVDTLLQDDTQSPYAFLRGSLSARSRRLLDGLANQRQKSKREESLSQQELLAMQQSVMDLKLEGNMKFSAGDVSAALSKYTEALNLCPTSAKKERIVLHSNRAQCHLLLQDAESAISDSTRALCLVRPVNCHGKSLWRRAQAYQLMGFAKESLLDAIMFINECTHIAEKRTIPLNQPTVPEYAELLVRKQMQAAWLFREAARRHGDIIPAEPLQASPEEITAAPPLWSESADTTAGKVTADNESASESDWETASESSDYSFTEENRERYLAAQVDEQENLKRAPEKEASGSSMFFPSPRGFGSRHLYDRPAFLSSISDVVRPKDPSYKHEGLRRPLDTELLEKRTQDSIPQQFYLDRGMSVDRFTRKHEHA